MAGSRVTIADIAQSLGVSKASVSRALNGLPGVGEDLRQTIIEHADQMGYKFTRQGTPSTNSSGAVRSECRSSGSKVIGLVVGDIRNPFYSELVIQVQKALNESGYTALVFNSEYQTEKEKEYLSMADQLGLAGLMLFTVPIDMGQEDFDELGIPVVFVNRVIPIEHYDSVLLDNYRAGYIAAIHLIELGHRRIGYISGPSTSMSSMQRLEGFTQALRNYYLDLDPTDVATGELRLEDGYALAKRLLERPSRPSAVIAGNDLMALGVLDYCREQGIRVPEELSLVGFDDIIFGRIRGVDLTTISHNTNEMGRQAADLMIRRLNEPDAEYRRLIQEPALIIRGTTERYR